MTFQEAVDLAESQQCTGSNDFQRWYGNDEVTDFMVEYDEDGRPVFVMKVGTDLNWARD